MKYYSASQTIDPIIVGGKHEGQIKKWTKYTIDEIRYLIEHFSTDNIQKLSHVEFELHYHAKITDIITGIMFSPSPWFVSPKFLSYLDKFKVHPYFLEPAIISYKNKYLDDYKIFQVAPTNFGMDLIDFTFCLFELHHKFPDKIEIPHIHSAEDFIKIKENIKIEFPNKATDIKIKKLALKSDAIYDLFYIPCLHVNYICSQRFAKAIIDAGIKGVYFSELRLDPFEKILPWHPGYQAP